MIVKPSDNSTNWGSEVRATIGAVNAQRTIYAFEPEPGLTAIVANGTDQSAALQALLDVAAARGGWTVDVSNPGAAIKLNTGITVNAAAGVSLVSDPSTLLDFTGISTTAGVAVTITGGAAASGEESTPLAGVRLAGPSGDPRSTPSNTSDVSTGIKASGIRMIFRDIYISNFGRGVDLANSNTFSVTFSGGAIDKCYVCIYADQVARSAIENGESFVFEDFTIFNAVKGGRITGNGVSFFFNKCRIDYLLTRFFEIEDAWVYFTSCHIEVGSTQISYLFDVDKNAHVNFTACHIIMGAGSPNITHFLFNPAKPPWNLMYGVARFANTDVFYVDPSGNGQERFSEDVVLLPASQTTFTYHTPFPIRWCAVSAEFVSSDFRTLPATFDQLRVTWSDSTTGNITVTASAANASDRLIRIRY